MQKFIGRQTVRLQNPPSIRAEAAVVGRREGEGPLGKCFDWVEQDAYFGEKTWEKAESAMLRRCFSTACTKAGLDASELRLVFGGDLLNQCTASALAMRDFPVPYLGLYGACSTMAEALSLAAMAIDGGFAGLTAAVCSSHFCTAERQFRLPLEYGGQRTPTAQWTVTGAGAAILSAEGRGPFVTHVTTGRIVDAGITDTSNMGAAMAPAAYETLRAHFDDTGRTPGYYDAIITGDLGRVGNQALIKLFSLDGVDVSGVAGDCGMLIYDPETQDVHAGGSGCGCCASVLCGFIIDSIRTGRMKRVLFAATGALMSTVSSQQGESIPGICHALAIEKEL